MRKLVAVLAVVMTFAAACSDDGGTTAGPSPEGTSGTAAPTNSADPGEGGEGGTSLPAIASGDYDCAELEAAIEAASNVAGDPTTSGSSDPQAEFEQSRASLAALGAAVPELADDINAALAGMDAIGAALASIGWDAANLGTDPARAVEFAQLLTNSDVMAMSVALQSVGLWFASECVS